MLAERTCVDLREGKGGVEKLERVFAGLLSRHEEGAVVKADEGAYGAPWGLSRWVKVRAFPVEETYVTTRRFLIGFV